MDDIFLFPPWSFLYYFFCSSLSQVHEIFFLNQTHKAPVFHPNFRSLFFCFQFLKILFSRVYFAPVTAETSPNFFIIFLFTWIFFFDYLNYSWDDCARISLAETREGDFIIFFLSSPRRSLLHDTVNGPKRFCFLFMTILRRMIFFLRKILEIANVLFFFCSWL